MNSTTLAHIHALELPKIDSLEVRKTTSVGLQRIFDTGDLDGDRWSACCIAVAGSCVIAKLGTALSRQLDHRRTG